MPGMIDYPYDYERYSAVPVVPVAPKPSSPVVPQARMPSLLIGATAGAMLTVQGLALTATRLARPSMSSWASNVRGVRPAVLARLGGAILCRSIALGLGTVGVVEIVNFKC